MKLNEYFIGKPLHKYKDADYIPKDHEDDDDDESDDDEHDQDDEQHDNDDDEHEPEPEDLPKGRRKLLELERLSHFIQFIDIHTSIIPKGAYYMDKKSADSTTIIKNTNFQGLSYAQSLLLSNYLIYKEPEHLETIEYRQRDTFGYLFNIFDPIDTNWYIRHDIHHSRVILRNSLFPGYEFISLIDKNHYYSGYIGHGFIDTSFIFKK